MLFFERKSEPLLHPHVFYYRVAWNILIALLIIFLSIFIGMVGYVYLVGLTWEDAFLESAMILSGMGPIAPLHSTSAKIFAGFYALFSGIVFLVSIAIILAPAFHRFLHRFHLEDEIKRRGSK